ncbi:alpha/beta hydrolase [Dyella mobilis]|uniref:Alpha/beta hydrolase n=1 Tax=Dyella mobilis TaxID=1849582 RepID=A0ABS2KIS8_9GAMM|nr:alpha/beta hydrolase [Dyella mobilis]MBM7130662.1 alpha/beta hydrolase [Dyella mobilis]GLQ97286.1 alpha/beta hydrolase [Dyella mobilis]
MILAIVVIVGIFFAVLFFAQNRLIYPAPPPSAPWGKLVLKRPDITLHGWIVHPEADSAWVVFGGNALALNPVGDQWRDCTDRAIYLMPYRGYEGQAGSPGEKALVADGIALVKQVEQAHRRVGIIGVSLGTGVATQVAAQTQPDQLLLVTPYDRLDLVAQDHYPYLPVRWLMRDTYDSAAAAANLRNVPVAILQADQDEIISAARTQALVAAFPSKPVRWLHVPTSHNGVWERPELCSFVKRGAT